MKTEKQVVNLELSQKIEKLGVKQESLWWWVPRYDVIGAWVKNGDVTDLKPTDYVLRNEEWFKESHNKIPMPHRHISAFTVAELGEILPDRVELLSNPNDLSWLEIQKCITVNKEDSWTVGYGNLKGKCFLFRIADTLANAMAKMLIYLKENKLIGEPK